MTLPKSLTTVTPFSKLLALFLLIILFIFIFLAGMIYQKNITEDKSTTNLIQKINITITPAVNKKISPTILPSPAPTISIHEPEGEFSLTAQHKEYENKTDYYSISYPVFFRVYQSGNHTSFGIRGSTQGQGQEFHDGLIINIEKKETDINLDNSINIQAVARLDMSKMLNPPSGYDFNEKQNIKVAGTNGVKIIGSELGSNFAQIYIPLPWPYVYEYLFIKANYSGERQQEYIQVFSEMLSSLKIILPQIEPEKIITLQGTLMYKKKGAWEIPILETMDMKDYGIIGQYMEELEELAKKGTIFIEAEGILLEQIMRIDHYKIIRN